MSYEMMDPRRVDPLPSTFVVGAAKAATTWLYTCLDDHPDALVPKVGEVDFFSKHYHRDFRWYTSQFRGYEGQHAVVDVSPTYLIDPGAPERIRDFDSDIKLIFCLRNPIERAYSHYCMHLRGGVASEDIDTELNPSRRYLQEGLYHSHIKRFDRYFNDKNMLFLVHDDLREDASDYIRRVYSFLNIDSSFRPNLLREKYHARKSRPRLENLYKTLVWVKNFIRRDLQSNLGTRLVKWVRRSGAVDLFHRLNQGPEFPDLSERKRNELADFFREDVRALSERLGRDLMHWVDDLAGEESREQEETLQGSS